MKILVLLAIVALALSVVHAGRRNRGGDRRGQRGQRRDRVTGLPSSAENVVGWNRNLGSVTVREYSYTLPDNLNQVFVVSRDKRQLKKAGYKKSLTIYDFTNGTSVVILKVKKWCFMLDKPQDLSRTAVMDQMAALNETTKEATAMVQMYPSLLDTYSVTVIGNRPELSLFCRKYPKALTTTAPESASSGGKTVMVTTPDHQISITKPSRRGRRPRKNRRN